MPEATLSFTQDKVAQPQILKPPTELPKPPMLPAKPYCPTGPGGVAGSTEQCDQNVPVAACPSTKDLETEGMFVKEIVDPKKTITVLFGPHPSGAA